MNNSKNLFSNKKLFLFKNPLYYTIICSFGGVMISALFVFGVVIKINGMSDLGWGETLIGVVAMILIWFALLDSFNEYICVDFNRNLITVHENLFNKKTFDLSKTCSINLHYTRPDYLILVGIVGVDYLYHLNKWCTSYMKQSCMLENKTMKVKRYQKFADKVNAIIKERYPDNKPINYDESDE
ncbi:MAG: hypothetical protein IJW61_03695 [Clostridia bacterium]|nr:hypothetical protein [Clostridia bacterium]